MTTTKLFEMHRWSVVKTEDGDFGIVDHDGDLVNEAGSLDDAIAICRESATASYRERLWQAVENAVWDNDVPLYVLQTIATLLGETPERL